MEIGEEEYEFRSIEASRRYLSQWSVIDQSLISQNTENHCAEVCVTPVDCGEEVTRAENENVIPTRDPLSPPPTSDLVLSENEELNFNSLLLETPDILWKQDMENCEMFNKIK